MLDQGFAALGLFDFARAVEEFFEGSVFVYQERGGFDADAGRAGDVIDRVARKGLHIYNALRVDAEFFMHAVAVDPAVFHCV